MWPGAALPRADDLVEVVGIEHYSHAELNELAAQAGLLLNEPMTRQQLLHHLEAAVFQELPARKPDDISPRDSRT